MADIETLTLLASYTIGEFLATSGDHDTDGVTVPVAPGASG